MKTLQIPIIFIIFIFIIGKSSILHAETITLTVEEAITRTLEKNFDIQLKEYTMKKLSIAKFASWNAVFPTINANSVLSHANTEPLSGSSQNQGSLNASLNFSVPLGSNLALGVIDAFIPYKDYKQGKINFDSLLASTTVSVHKAYLDLYIAYETLRYLKEKLLVDEQKSNDAETSFSGGVMDEHTYLKIQLAALVSQIDVDSQKNKFEIFQDQFSLLLEYPLDTEYVLVDKIQEIDPIIIEQWLLSENIAQNKSLQELEVTYDIMKTQRIKAIFGFLPSLTLGYLIRYDLLDDPYKSPWFNDNWSKDLGSLSLTFSFPVSEYHPWSKSVVQLKQLNQDILSNQTSQIQLKQLLLQQLDAEKRSLNGAVSTLNLQKQRINTSKRAYDLANQGYRGGLRNVVDFQEAANELYNAQTSYLSIQADIIKHILNIEILIGQKEK